MVSGTLRTTESYCFIQQAVLIKCWLCHTRTSFQHNDALYFEVYDCVRVSEELRCEGRVMNVELGLTMLVCDLAQTSWAVKVEL